MSCFTKHAGEILYAAVYHFGPRWEVKTVSEEKMVIGPDGQPHQKMVKRYVSKRLQTAEPNAALLDKLQKFVNDKNPTLDELRKVDPRDL